MVRPWMTAVCVACALVAGACSDEPGSSVRDASSASKDGPTDRPVDGPVSSDGPGTAPPPQTFTVGGQLSGLEGAGLILGDGGTGRALVTANGPFLFPTRYAAGAALNVAVFQRPLAPAQTCTVTGGLIASVTADVTSVVVTCATDAYTVGGTVVGLTGTGLVLQDAAGEDLSISGNGPFIFPTAVKSGQAFTVTVKTQPTTPPQSCQISGGSGTVGDGKVTSVVVNCASNTFVVGGSVSGLVGQGLVLQDNDGDDASVTSNGAFAFATPLPAGGHFQVTVKTQPASPGQTCVVSAGAGTVAASNVTSVMIACTINRFHVGGTVTGLVGTGLLLQDNLGDNLSVTAAGTFTFATSVPSGAPYGVTVLSQPHGPFQTCTVTMGNGTVIDGDVTGVAVTCATNRFRVGGTVVGLTGSGLVLELNGGDPLPVSANGTFAFDSTITTGDSFTVTVKTQPSGPVQSCAVQGGSGTDTSGDISSVVVSCASDRFTVGGTVSGLTGSGLVLALNNGVRLPISANGGFAFPSLLSHGWAYVVVVDNQPLMPSQECTVSAGGGNVGTSNVTSVVVACSTTPFVVGGTVSGLTGSGLILRNGGGDDLPISANGAFHFATPVPSGQSYAVTGQASPTAPWQTCVVGHGTGPVVDADIDTVTVTCTTDRHTIAGTITGLVASVMIRNGTHTLALATNGMFTLTEPVASGEPFDVTVVSQPSGPSQTCVVTRGFGIIAGADVTDVAIVCTTNIYTVGGSISGLVGSGLVLRNNDGDDLGIALSATTFAFPTPVASNGGYSVSIQTQPASPPQTCTVGGATGVVGGSDVTSVTINCTIDGFLVGGTVSGLSGTGLVLQNNGGDNRVISGNGMFSFATPVPASGVYNVTVLTEPTNVSQTCMVSNGSGIVGSASITSVVITCSTNTYYLSANVSGLSGSGLVIQNNGAGNVPVGASGPASFGAVASGSMYSISVLTQPTTPVQLCTPVMPTGTITTTDVVVNVTCVDVTHTIGGVVANRATVGMVLRNNGGDDLTVTGAGVFTFATPLAPGAMYGVTVLSDPPGMSCQAVRNTGTVGSTNVTDVGVICRMTLNVCGGSGQFGPSDCSSAYAGTSLESLVTVMNGYQIWTAPITSRYSFSLVGAQGGRIGLGNPHGGLGAVAVGLMDVTAGTPIYFRVGQQGLVVLSSSGGGGGSFMGLGPSSVLMVAGGGGGGSASATVPGGPGTATTAGGNGHTNDDGTGTACAGGTAGGGGSVCAGYGSAGAGYSAAGADDPTPMTVSGGNPWTGDGAGGIDPVCPNRSQGGFGGGGAGNACNLVGGGGGGGYSGGGSGAVAGGGGSYVDASMLTHFLSAGANTGNGYITIYTVP